MTTQEFPRPPILLVLFSVAIILGACVGMGAAIAEMVMWPDVCSVISAMLVIALAVMVAVGHYQAFLRREQSAAQVMWIVYVGLGLLPCLYLAESIERYREHPSQLHRDGIRNLVQFCAIWIAAFAFLTWLAYRWYRKLKAFNECSESPRSSRPWMKRDSLAVVPAIVVIAVSAVVFAAGQLPPCAEHVSIEQAASFLPQSATDISYCKGYRGTFAAEFSVDEPDFVAWVKEEVETPATRADGIKLEEVGRGQRITRYYELSTALDGPAVFQLGPGLSFSWSFEDEGIHAAYDRDTNRAYYFVHHH